MPSTKIAVIQGDGINEDSIREILAVLMGEGYSATNVAFGMGGALLQMVNRDTQKFAYKASAGIIDGNYQPIYKDPVTDPGKRSKDGILDLVRRNGKYETLQGKEFGKYSEDSLLRVVYRNGDLLIDESLGDIRAR